MPYIPQADRKMIDSAISDLADRITTKGQLNYAMTRLAVLHLSNQLKSPGYVDMMNIVGTFEMAKIEFYAEICSGYENSKKNLNGDVYTELRKFV